MSKLAKTFLAFTIIALISCFSCMGIDIYLDAKFDAQCADYIVLASRATTVGMAKEHLGKAISYAEEKGLTTGDTNIFIDYPRKDISIWYRNLVETYSLLEELDENSTLEESNVLLKVEALTENTENGARAIYPESIYEYPYHVFFFWWILVSLIMWFTCLILFVVVYALYG